MMFTRVVNKKKHNGKLISIIFILIISITSLFILFDIKIKPTIISMAEAEVYNIAVLAMNDAVTNVLVKNYKYTELIDVMVDTDGNISGIQANTILINAIASDTSKQAQLEIRQVGEKGIDVPMGAVTGSEMLAGWGPNIRVKMIPIGAVSTDFASEFETAGINQTRHKIYIKMNTEVRIVIPLGSDIINVSTRVPITETIIVGDVPHYYLNVDETDKTLDLVPKGE